MITSTRWQLQSDSGKEGWVDAPMENPNPMDGSRCADEVIFACKTAPGLYDRRFRVLQITRTDYEETRSWGVVTPTKVAT